MQAAKQRMQQKVSTPREDSPFTSASTATCSSPAMRGIKHQDLGQAVTQDVKVSDGEVVTAFAVAEDDVGVTGEDSGLVANDVRPNGVIEVVWFLPQARRTTGDFIALYKGIGAAPLDYIASRYACSEEGWGLCLEPSGEAPPARGHVALAAPEQPGRYQVRYVSAEHKTVAITTVHIEGEHLPVTWLPKLEFVAHPSCFAEGYQQEPAVRVLAEEGPLDGLLRAIGGLFGKENDDKEKKDQHEKRRDSRRRSSGAFSWLRTLTGSDEENVEQSGASHSDERRRSSGGLWGVLRRNSESLPATSPDLHQVEITPQQDGFHGTHNGSTTARKGRGRRMAVLKMEMQGKCGD